MAELDRIVRERVDGKPNTGIVAGIVFPDGQTRVVAYGDAEAGRPLGANSVFEIGSITKVFTATLLSDMVQRGEVKLDDPVARFLPETVDVPVRGGGEIELVDLATQTSGLPRLPTGFVPADPANPYADYAEEKLYEFLSNYALPRDIGSDFEYSNVGVGLLGHALALHAGMGFEDLLKQRILEPLGMSMTGITIAPDMKPHLTSGHDARGDVVPYWDFQALAGAGALRSNITDMLRFAAATLDNDGGPLQRAMADAHVPRHRIDPQTQIGLNWLTVRPFDSDLVWHNGGTAGFVSFVGLDKARGMAVVVLSNSAAQSVDDIGFHVLDPRIPLAPTPAVREEIALPPEVLQGYVGVYQGEGFTLTITRSPEGLIAQPEGQTAERIYAETETVFFLKSLDVQITFQRDPGGAVTGLVLHQGGQDIAGKKIR